MPGGLLAGPTALNESLTTIGETGVRVVIIFAVGLIKELKKKIS